MVDVAVGFDFGFDCVAEVEPEVEGGFGGLCVSVVLRGAALALLRPLLLALLLVLLPVELLCSNTLALLRGFLGAL